MYILYNYIYTLHDYVYSEDIYIYIYIYIYVYILIKWHLQPAAKAHAVRHVPGCVPQKPCTVHGHSLQLHVCTLQQHVSTIKLHIYIYTVQLHIYSIQLNVQRGILIKWHLQPAAEAHSVCFGVTSRGVYHERCVQYMHILYNYMHVL